MTAACCTCGQAILNGQTCWYTVKTADPQDAVAPDPVGAVRCYCSRPCVERESEQLQAAWRTRPEYQKWLQAKAQEKSNG